MNAPNFFVVGAGRCGTTSLHRMLGGHPDVFVCRHKSPNHFAAHIPQPDWEGPVARSMARQWIRDTRDYAVMFEGSDGHIAIGDVSPVYLQALDVAPRVHERHPDARIVAILRDPVARAHAHFLGRQRDGIEPPSTFAERIAHELDAPLPDDVAFGHLLGIGRYRHFLQPWIDRFGRERVLVVFHQDLVERPADVLRTVFDFVGVDPTFIPSTEHRLNRSGRIRHPAVRALWTRSAPVRTRLRPFVPAALRQAVGARVLRDLERPAIDPALRARLVPLFEEDVAGIETLTGRDLTSWRQP